jgi:murein DD-endopeptidase MepM/ murein hydrolase activator NlpD
MKIIVSESQYKKIIQSIQEEEESSFSKVLNFFLQNDNEEDNDEEDDTKIEYDISSDKLSSPLKKFYVNPYSKFGVVRPGLDTKRPHSGADLSGAQGETVYAPGDGKIRVSKKYGYNGGCGGTLYITHPNGLESRFCHLSDIFVNVGDKVERGDKVGLVGGTKNTRGAGLSTGPHLHYTLAKTSNNELLDPEKYVEKKFYDKDSDSLFNV